MKTAIITGACSGIGLSLTLELISKASPQWRVVLADINATAYNKVKSTLDPARHIFVQTDVSRWADMATLFKQAYAWSGNRIDFFAANAGIDDRETILQATELDDEPAKPDLRCLEIDLVSILYGLRLFIHFTRKTRRDLAIATDDTSFQPKMVITASMAGQYPFFLKPLYTAAKHGCVGLVRSAAPALMQYENITINCLMPGFVDTGIMPPGVAARWPPEHNTPMSTIMRAFGELIDETGRVVKDGKSDGRDGQVKSGCTVECSTDQLYYREPVPYANPSQEWLTNQSRHDGILGIAVKEMLANMAKGNAGHAPNGTANATAK